MPKTRGKDGDAPNPLRSGRSGPLAGIRHHKGLYFFPQNLATFAVNLRVSMLKGRGFLGQFIEVVNDNEQQ